ncbi:predicted protein [Clostridium sp. CAG:762]|jgi:gas vesicle protein|nr:predicted protein [Clostridium sp. CAG:762]
MSKKGFGKFLAGASLGAGLALLFAPKKGSETRQELKLKLDELWIKAKNVDTDEVKETFQKKVDEIKKELSDLDKEKAIDLAKKKSEDLKKQCEELLKLAKEKGTPVLEGVAKDIKEKAIVVTKEVLKKLEDSNK